MCSPKIPKADRQKTVGIMVTILHGGLLSQIPSLEKIHILSKIKKPKPNPDFKLLSVSLFFWLKGVYL